MNGYIWCSMLQHQVVASRQAPWELATGVGPLALVIMNSGPLGLLGDSKRRYNESFAEYYCPVDKSVDKLCWKAGGRQYEVVVLDAKPKALRGGRYLSTVCAL